MANPDWEFTAAELAAECKRECGQRRRVYQRQADNYGSGVMTPIQQRRIRMMEELAERMLAEVESDENDLFSGGGS